MRPDYDLAIVGSGFGGALLAMVARRIGLSVLLLERGQHPRFAIGESTSPLTNLLLEQTARRYDLSQLLPLTTYGSWQHTYPQLGCGLKRGFTFFQHETGRPYQVADDRTNQLLVAASPRDEIADTHWLRADVDEFLMREAAATGADYEDEVTLDAPECYDGKVTLTGTRHGRPFQTTARLIVDATGPRGFLNRSLDLPEADFAEYPPTQALYSHFTGVRRCDTMEVYQTDGTPPYPLDDAAVHHVFDGGWMWILRFGNGITSAGIAATNTLARQLGLGEGAPAWERLLARFPTIREQFADAKPVQPFVYAPRLAFRSATASGPGWAMLPSAAAFVDPLFSTGIPLTLLGIERLARILEENWGRDDLDRRLGEYGEVTLREADSVADFISACYAAFGDFPAFAALSMFYFVAASYSEMARRLDRPQLIRRFLAADHPQFGSSLRRCAASLRQMTADGTTRDTFLGEVAEAVACLNVAGLCDPAKRNWYGVDLNDVILGSAKLGFTPEEMTTILQNASWT